MVQEKLWPNERDTAPMEQMSPKLERRRMICGTGLVALGLLAAALCLNGCAEPSVFRKETHHPRIEQPAAKVKLTEAKESVKVSSQGSFVIKCFPAEGGTSAYYSSAEILVELGHDEIAIRQTGRSELESGLSKVEFFPSKKTFPLRVDGNPYRGGLEITKSRGSLAVFNVVHVEDYIKGVVAAEMGKLSWLEIEALKAQAVAARTYCLTRLDRGKDREYDLEATVADQVYAGVVAETHLASRAVELTRGEVLTYRGRLINAYYHANSGGKTEYIEKIWDKPKEDYLISIDDRAFCSWSDNYQWEESWTKQALETNLQKFLSPSARFSGAEFGSLVNLRIRNRSGSGRVGILDVVTDWGTYQICGDKIRWALRKGNNHNSILPSTCFDLEIIRDDDGAIKHIIARGRGNGHGVGMCQTGAIGMARKGHSYKDILKYYYLGAEVSGCYGKGKPQAQALVGLNPSGH